MCFVKRWQSVDCRGGVPSPPGFLGLEELAVLLLVVFTLCCLFHPISLVLPKETGWSPKEKRLWGGGAPVRFRDPPASPTGLWRPCRTVKVSASRTDLITRPRGEGFGPAKVWPSKSFLPRFFTKKRAGSRGCAPGRAPQRAELSCAHKAQEGVKGGTLAGGSPFAGGGAARSLCASP